MALADKHYYYILGLEKDATAQAVKDAYRKLAKKFHPDNNNSDKFFENLFKEVQEAYEVLSDPTKKRQYDAECEKSGEDQFVWILQQQEILRKKEEVLKKKEEELRKYESRDVGGQNNNNKFSTKGKELTNKTSPGIEMIFIGIVILIVAFLVIRLYIDKLPN